MTDYEKIQAVTDKLRTDFCVGQRVRFKDGSIHFIVVKIEGMQIWIREQNTAFRWLPYSSNMFEPVP